MASLHKANATTVAFSLEYGQSTDQGSRAQNEDSALVFPTDEGLVAIVADGMGGGIDGQLFSKRAVERAQAKILAVVDLKPQQRVEQAVFAAAEELHAMRISENRYSKSGSTIVLALVTKHEEYAEVVVANVGDSRAYIIHADGKPEIVTRDHSYTQQLIEEGSDETAARSDPQGQLLTHVLGQPPDPSVIRKSLRTYKLKPNEQLLLCSDGITKVIPPTSLAQLMQGHTAQVAADRVVRQAVHDKQKRGRDNATAVVVGFSQVATVNPWYQGSHRLIPILVGLLLLLLAGGGFMLASGSIAAPPASTSLPVVSDQTVELPATPTLTAQPTKDQSTGVPATSTPGASITPTSTPTNTPTNTPTQLPPTPRPTNTVVPVKSPIPTRQTVTSLTSLPTPSLLGSLTPSPSTPIPTESPQPSSTPIESPTPTLSTPTIKVTPNLPIMPTVEK